MTVKRRFAQSSLFSSLIFLIAACSTPHPSTASSDSTEIKATVSSPQTMDGSVLVVSVQLPSPLESAPVTGEFEGITLPFFKNGGNHEAILGVPYDHKAGPASVKITVGEGKHSRVVEAPFTVIKGDYASESIHVTDPSKVKPQNPKHIKRIVKELAEIKETYNTVISKKYWDGPFQLPIKSTITSRYGTKRLYNGKQNSFHPGLDFKAAEGTPIHADAAGLVVMAKDLFFTGNTVMINHGYGVITLYAHMSKLDVKKGQEVKAGELLGLSGMTGRVTGPHLHWQAMIQKQKVNPMDLTQVMK
jgi:hypothetical protein